MSALAKIFLATLLYLVGFDLLGVLACSIFDVASVLPLKIGNTSTMLFYTVWTVDGIFCGLLGYDAGGRISSEKGPGDWTGRTGLLVVLVQCLLVAGLWSLPLVPVAKGNRIRNHCAGQSPPDVGFRCVDDNLRDFCALPVASRAVKVTG